MPVYTTDETPIFCEFRIAMNDNLLMHMYHIEEFYVEKIGALANFELL